MCPQIKCAYITRKSAAIVNLITYSLHVFLILSYKHFVLDQYYGLRLTIPDTETQMCNCACKPHWQMFIIELDKQHHHTQHTQKKNLIVM